VADGQPGDRLAGPGRYHQKGSEVEARQLLDDLRNHTEIAAWVEAGGGHALIPFAEPCLYIETAEGQERAGIGDWIVRFPAGTFRAIPYDKFTAAFEALTEEPRPGDQQLPVPNDGPSMHDLVITDLGVWTIPHREAVQELLLERKRIGLERYGSMLQAGNQRDWYRDLTDELTDAAVYAKQGICELGDNAPAELGQVYRLILRALSRAVRIPEAPRG